MELETVEVNGVEIVDPNQWFMVPTNQVDSFKSSQEFVEMLNSIRKLKEMVEEQEEDDDIDVLGTEVEARFDSDFFLPEVTAEVKVDGVDTLAEAVEVVEERLGVYE